MIYIVICIYKEITKKEIQTILINIVIPEYHDKVLSKFEIE